MMYETVVKLVIGYLSKFIKPTPIIYLLIGLLVILPGYLYYRSHLIEIGIEKERAIWLKKEQAADLKVAQLKADLEKLNQKHQDELIKIQNEYYESTEKLNDDISKLSSRGLYVTATKCESRERMPETDNSTGLHAGGAGRVRLSGEDEENIIALVRDAQLVAEQYKTARQLILSRPDCFLTGGE